MMEYYFYAGAFLLGGVVIYLLTRWRIRFLLKNELRSYRKELKKKKKWWPPEPYPMLPILKRRKDHYKSEAEHRERELEELTMQLEQELQKLASTDEELEELRRENLELTTIVNSPTEDHPVSSEYPVSPGRGTVPKASPGGASRGDFRGPTTGKAGEEVIVHYFGIPDSEGNFPASQAGSQYDSRKLYMIVTRPGSDRGELHYISGELDMKAINNIDYYLVPVCEIFDISVRNSASRVLQEAKGAALLSSGKWICTTRVKVKLL